MLVSEPFGVVVKCNFEFWSDGAREHAPSIKDKHKKRLRAKYLLGFFRMGKKTKAIALMRKKDRKIK